MRKSTITHLYVFHIRPTSKCTCIIIFAFYFLSQFAPLTTFCTASKIAIAPYEVSPVVERFSFPTNLTRGKRLRVICAVTEGDLPLEVEWWKGGHRIPRISKGIQVRRIDEYTSLLAISFLETTHAGNYSCVAKNSVATFTRSATLTIRGK